MDGEWLYARNGKRHGPFPKERMKKLVSDGWLLPDDLVWTKGMPAWSRAGDQEWLFGHKAGRQLHEAFTALTVGRTPQPAVKTKQTAKTKTTSPAAPLIDWDNIAPRHLVAALGAFITLLGLAFTLIAHTPLSLALTIGGMVVVIGGLSVEIGRLFRGASGNSRSALDGSRRNLPARFEGPHAAAVLPEAEPLPAVKPAAAEPSPTSSPIAVPSGGSVTVINQMPVKRWSPGVAALLTFFIPGLGQIYKGQVINGLVWFFLVTMGYAALILPGLILHFFCIIGALSGNPRDREQDDRRALVARQGGNAPRGAETGAIRHACPRRSRAGRASLDPARVEPGRGPNLEEIRSLLDVSGPDEILRDDPVPADVIGFG